MSFSLPSFAIFPGVPAGTPLASGAEGLAAFGTLPGSSDATPAFGSMLAAATVAPAGPALATDVTQEGQGNPTVSTMPGAEPALTCPTARTAMPGPFHWNPTQEKPASMNPGSAMDEGWRLTWE